MTNQQKQKPREFWLSNNDLKRAEEKLDLDESTETSLYLYPHKDKLFRLTKVIEHSAYQSLLEQSDKLAQTLKYLDCAITAELENIGEHTECRQDDDCDHCVLHDAFKDTNEALEEYKKWREGV